MGNKEASGTWSLPLEGLTFYSRKTCEQTFLKGERSSHGARGTGKATSRGALASWGSLGGSICVRG